MDLEFNRKEKVVGIFITVVVVLLFSSIIIIGRGKDWFKKYNIYYTTFAESYNLQPNASVKLHNAEIGKVKKITLVEDKVKVKLAVLAEHAYRIRKGTKTIVTSPTFIGSEYVSIIPGNSRLPLIEKEGEIPSEEKKSLSDFLDELEIKKIGDELVNAVQVLTETVHILRDPDGPLFTALKSLNNLLISAESITEDIQAGKGTIGDILKSTELLDKIMDSIDKTGVIIDDIAMASAKAPETVDMVRESLVITHNIGNSLFASAKKVKGALNDVEESLISLKAMLKNLEKGSRNVPDITRSTKNGIHKIIEGVDDINRVVKSMHKSILIRSNLPKEPEGENIDAGLRN